MVLVTLAEFLLDMVEVEERALLEPLEPAGVL
jgi:hypothetical protein